MVDTPRQLSLNDIEQRKRQLREKLEMIRIDVQKNNETFKDRLELECKTRWSSIIKLGSRSRIP